MITQQNPFQYSNPVYERNDFFNRQVEITRLINALYQSRSVQVIGQYRIGKSSLLRYVQENVGESLGDERSIGIYYDLSRRPRIYDGNDFFARIWQLASQALVQRGQTSAALVGTTDLTDLWAFEDYLARWIDKEGYKLIFFLDEAGLIAGDPDFDPDFFDNLRSEKRLVYILAASRSLGDYAHDQVKSSPFWNEPEVVRVRLFETRAVSYSLMCGPVERCGFTWPDEAKSFIYERGGQHPCYIQMAAAMLYDTLESGQLNYKKADTAFRDTAIEHFRFLWMKALRDRNLPEREGELRMTLLDLVRGRAVDNELASELCDRALVWQNEVSGAWEPFSAWFGQWLARWSTDDRRLIENQGKLNDELAQNKAPLSMQHTGAVKEGQLLAGKYRVRRILSGSNRINQVAEAYDEVLRRRVAIKCLRLGHEPDDIAQRLRENLIRGASIMAGLNHTNIGKVWEVLLEPLAIVMEWIEGDSLQDKLDKDERLSAVEIIKIGCVLAATLQYIHERGHVHRDIKPGNIILTCAGPVFIDFDITRVASRETITRLADGSYGYVGTVEYSAPEQLLNPEGTGPPTDMFALGVVLYQSLTGNFPYKSGNVPYLYQNGFPKPERYDIPESLYRILCDLLNEKPELRLSATQLEHRLRDCGTNAQTAPRANAS